MAKRSKENITLGSGKAYIVEYTSGETLSHTDLCKPENLLGYIKGGAELSYTEETYEEKDDLGFVSKVITTSEEAFPLRRAFAREGGRRGSNEKDGRRFSAKGAFVCNGLRKKSGLPPPPCMGRSLSI
jgi:hypothetical protein